LSGSRRQLRQHLCHQQLQPFAVIDAISLRRHLGDPHGIETALAALAERPEPSVDHTRVALIGHSYGAWRFGDALTSCAFRSARCAYALGDTPGQRFMDDWSDGVPVIPARDSLVPGTPVPS
jgi:hypothetical protein